MKKMKHLVLILLSVFALSGCVNDDSAPTPTDPTIDKGHEEWSKVEFIFKEGHLHGSTFHGDPDYPDEIKYFNRTQKITYSYDDKGNVVADTKEPIRFLAGNTYALIINYYNKAGKLMNSEFVNDGMDKIHQHFFYADKVISTKNNTSVEGDNLFRYIYRDTDPVDGDFKPRSEDVKLRSRTWDSTNPNSYDPIGLKGYFIVPADKPYYNFDLKIVLAHFKVDNKLNKETGKPFSYNDKPSPLSFATDLSLNIPVHIYSSISFQETDELKKSTFYPDAAKEFGTTVEEVEEIYKLLFTLDPEGGEFWM